MPSSRHKDIINKATGGNHHRSETKMVISKKDNAEKGIKKDVGKENFKTKDAKKEDKTVIHGCNCAFGGMYGEYTSNKSATADQKFNDDAVSTIAHTEASQIGESDMNWTEEQDDTIWCLKENKKTWAEIAAAVGTNKKQVQRRYREMKVEADAYHARLAKDDSQTTFTSGLAPNKVNSGDYDWPNPFDDDDSGVEGGINSNDGCKKKNKKKGDKTEKKTKPNLEKVEKSAPNASSDDSFYDDPFFTDPDVLESYDNKDPKSFHDMCKGPLAVKENNGKEKDLDTHWDSLSSDMFASALETGTAAAAPSVFSSGAAEPPQPTLSPQLRPDENWSADDCYLLKEIEAKYERNKWLQIQADFYNWSGRMVDASLIQAKFQNDGTC